MLFLVFGFSIVFATADRFIVEISSNPLMLNEAADLTIRAVDKNGDTVKSFIGDALLDVKGIDEGWFTLPNWGIVNFTPSDQGLKKFFKGVIFKQIGKATITAEDILDDKLLGKLDIEVKDPTNAGTLKKISVVSPTVWGIETNANVNIIWSIGELPNSPLQVLIDGKVNASSSTNAQGEFSIFANDLSKGDHTLLVQVTNSAWTVLAKSDEITFSVSDLANELYKSISVDPGTTAKEWEIITITMNTAPQVSTVELLILGNSYYMERVKSSVFEKRLKFNTANPSIQIDAKLSADGNTKTYQNIEKLTIIATDTPTNTGVDSVNENSSWTAHSVNQAPSPQSIVKITSIKSLYDISAKKYMISRTVEWTPARYLILISSNKNTVSDNPELIQTTTEKQILVTPPSSTTYYLQVIGADSQSNPIWEPSDIIMLTAPDEYKPSAPTCVVDAIKLTDSVIAGKHYLVRNKVVWVDRYVVYQSNNASSSINQMTKIGETSENKFEFAYDDQATQPLYKYFAVQWICSDGTTTNVSGSTQVQVGPWNIALYVCMISWFMYVSYSILRKQEV